MYLLCKSMNGFIYIQCFYKIPVDNIIVVFLMKTNTQCQNVNSAIVRQCYE